MNDESWQSLRLGYQDKNGKPLTLVVQDERFWWKESNVDYGEPNGSSTYSRELLSSPDFNLAWYFSHSRFTTGASRYKPITLGTAKVK